MKREDLKVPIEKFCYVVDPQSLGFKDTTEVQPLRRFVGQKRAKDALRFALEIQALGYDVFVSGPPGSGRKSLVLREIELAAKEKKKQLGFELKDYCYVYNFDAPDKPKLLIFKAGEGRKFAIRIWRLLRHLKKDISDKIKAEQKKVIAEYNVKKDMLEIAIERQLKQENFILVPREGSNIYISQPMSLKDGTKPMSKEERGKLSDEMKQEIVKREEKVGKIITEYQNEKRATEEYRGKHIKELEGKVFISTVADLFEDLNYSDNNVLEYLQGLQEVHDIIKEKSGKKEKEFHGYFRSTPENDNAKK